MKKFAIIFMILIGLVGIILGVHYTLITRDFFLLAVAGGISLIIMVIEFVYIEEMAQNDAWALASFTLAILSLVSILGLGYELIDPSGLPWVGWTFSFLVFLFGGISIPATIAGLLDTKE